MRDRCRNPKNWAWPHYGGRGIRVCERWNDFAVFAVEMGERQPGATLERRDNDGDYEPGNCLWATRKEQMRNQRVTRRVVIEGREYIAADLADIAEVKTDTIVERVRRALSFEGVIGMEKGRDLSGLTLGGEANGALQRAKTHCNHGHEFTAENTYITKEGWRNCRKCKALKEARRRARIAA